MRILLFGDASNYHNSLAQGLRRLGHEVAVASDGSTWMATERDIDLRRRLPGKAGGALLAAKLRGLMASGRLAGWDVVQVGTPFFMTLRPRRLRWAFDYLRAHNSLVVNSAYAAEPGWIDYCLDPGEMRYNEWRIGGQPGPLARRRPELLAAWTTPEMRSYSSHVMASVDGALTALYEYQRQMLRQLPAERVAYAGIPIATDALTLRPGADDAPRRVRLFLGVHRDRMVEKGTDRMLAAARRVAERHPDRCELTYVENVPYRQYVGMMRSSHVVLDQLYSYTPATNALLAMAQGLVAVSGAEPEYYDFIGERDNRPIVNALPDDDALLATLEQVVLHPERLPALARASRAFVEKHNAQAVVARRALAHWTALRADAAAAARSEFF